MIQKSKLFNDDELNKLFFYKGKDGKYVPYYKSDIQQLNPLNPFDFDFLFKEFNLPFIEDIWINSICYLSKNNKSLKFVFGRYLATMKLKGFRGFHYGLMALNETEGVENKTLLDLKPFTYNLKGEKIV